MEGTTDLDAPGAAHATRMPSWRRVARRVPIAGFAYRTVRNGARYLGFASDYRAFRRAAAEKPGRLSVRWSDRQPQLGDRSDSVVFEPHYLYHPAWAARVLARLKPERHVDVSSTVSFVTIASAFVPIDYYEFRPAHLGLEGLRTYKGDLTSLPLEDGSVPSLSCMHTIEHVGLGRYGDSLDVEGDHRAAEELMRVLAPGGSLLIVVPVGRPVVRFNANRIYSREAVLELFAGLRLKESLLITDDARLVPDASAEETNTQDEGCGCYWFVKD